MQYYPILFIVHVIVHMILNVYTGIPLPGHADPEVLGRHCQHGGLQPRGEPRWDFMGFKPHRLVIGIFFWTNGLTITNLGSFE